MIYERSLRKAGESLRLGATAYQITGVEGCGGSSVVYRAFYQDSLNGDQSHQVLVKELFPWHPKGAIYRDGQGNICCLPEGRALMEASCLRYREGNRVNLELLKDHPAHISGNLNSYEAYGTYYTVLSFHGGESLAAWLAGQKEPGALKELSLLFLKILGALEYFHRNRLLHLDISPENILLVPEQALLIDYNSVWRLEELSAGEFLFSEREGYSAPEIRMQDRERIGFPSDTYSLCAVFYQMVTGSILTEREIIGNNLKKRLWGTVPAFEGAPRSAVFKAVQILTRGLYTLPDKRYQTVEELRADVRELINRIEGSGVSHSAIWESSRSLCRRQEQAVSSYLRQEVLVCGESRQESLLKRLTWGESFLLTGPGGMGKTRFLKELWKQNTERYIPTHPLVCYIPLRDYQERGREKGYIRGYLLRHLRCGGKNGFLEEALHELELIFDRRTGQGVSLILLLDGFNEAGACRENLLKEMEGLAAREGVSLLVTERSGAVQEYGLQTLTRMELMPLAPEVVEAELTARGLPPPGEPRLMELLRIPMMLELYEQTSLLETGEEGMGHATAPMIQTSEELAKRYLNQLLLYQLRVDSGNEAAQLRYRYILTHLLPAIALKMEEKQSTILTFEELFALCGESWRLPHEETFGRSFRPYLGKARKLFEGMENEAEWYDFAVEEQLIGKLRLLVETESGCYRLFHDNFISCLAAAGRENRKLLDRGTKGGSHGTGRRNAYGRMAAILLMLALAGGGAAAWRFKTLPAIGAGKPDTGDTVTLSEEHKRQLYQMAERLLLTANALEQEFEAQETLFAAFAQALAGEENAGGFRILAAELLSALPQGQREDYQSYVILLSVLYPELDISGAEDFFQSPGELYAMLGNLSDWLISLLEDDAWDAGQKKAYLAEAEAFLDAYRQKCFHEFCLAAALLDSESREYLLSAETLRYASQFDAYYLTHREELDRGPEALIRQLDSHLVSGSESLAACRTTLENRMQATGGFALEASPWEQVKNHLAVRLTQMDEASGLYDQALLQTSAYLEGGSSKEEAAQTLREIQEKLNRLKQQAGPYPVDEAMSALLVKTGIDPEEYRAIVDEYQGNLVSYGNGVERLLNWLLSDEEENARKALELEQETLWGMQEGFRGYYFCAVNYLFAEWGEAEAAAVREKLLEPLVSLAAKDLPWETDKALIEEKAGAFLDVCESWKNRREQGLMEASGQ